MTNMRRGFTMIELIFVIVIIGILAAVAIPKLAATRDDAKISKSIANLKTCINDMGAEYTARGDANLTNSSACGATTTEGCFTLDQSVLDDGNLTVSPNTSASDTWCIETGGAQDTALAQDLNGTHQFGGSRVDRN